MEDRDAFYFEESEALVSKVISRVGAKFAEWGHHPSPEHMASLSEIARCMFAMYYSDRAVIETLYPGFDNLLLLSHLPCGMGKTTTLIESVRALIEQDHKADCGFIIMLSRLDQILEYRDKLGLSENDYSVVTGNRDYNKHGNPYPRNARVLFTTQQMLESYVFNKGRGMRKFADIDEYHYKGKPRQVRVWDEAMLPATILTVTRRQIMSIINDISHVKGGMDNELDDFSMSLAGRKNGELIVMPDLTKYNHALEAVLDAVKTIDMRRTVETLYSLSGLVVRVKREKEDKEGRNQTTIQYADILPQDLAPTLILDASGLERKMYTFWAEHRKGLKFIESPRKTYEGFTIHHWDYGAGKLSHWMHGKYKDIALGVAKTIDEIPKAKKILVVHFNKESIKNIDMAKEIMERLTTPFDADRIRFITWGSHTASNDYSEFEVVILAGLLEYNNAQYEAHGLAAKKQDVAIPLTPDEAYDIRIGELTHHVMQAACRGKVRHAIGSNCPPSCHLFAIYASRAKGESRLPGKDLLTQIFPGSVYHEWIPLAAELKSPPQIKLRDMLLEEIGISQRVTKRHLMDRLGIKKKPDLERRLVGVSRWLKANKKIGIIEDKNGLKLEYEKGVLPF